MTESTPAPTNAGALADRLAAHDMPPMPKWGEPLSERAAVSVFMLTTAERNLIVAALRAGLAQEPAPAEQLYRRVITKDRIYYEPAAPQQSPRLDREWPGPIERMVTGAMETSRLEAIEECARHLYECYPGHAAINAYCAAIRSLALTAVVSSTSRREDVPTCDCGFTPDACKTNHCYRKQMAGSGLNAVPDGYSKLPDGVVCKCFKMWRATDGSHWCCQPSPTVSSNLPREVGK